MNTNYKEKLMNNLFQHHVYINVECLIQNIQIKQIWLTRKTLLFQTNNENCLSSLVCFMYRNFTDQAWKHISLCITDS